MGSREWRWWRSLWVGHYRLHVHFCSIQQQPSTFRAPDQGHRVIQYSIVQLGTLSNITAHNHARMCSGKQSPACCQLGVACWLLLLHAAGASLLSVPYGGVNVVLVLPHNPSLPLPFSSPSPLPPAPPPRCFSPVSALWWCECGADHAPRQP